MSDSGSVSSYSPIVSEEEAIRASFISGADEPIKPSFSVNSISTFSSVEQDAQDLDDTLFETFNGSTNDYATATATDTDSSVTTKPISPTEPLNITKTRDPKILKSPSSTRVRTFTPVDSTKENGSSDSSTTRLTRLKRLEAQMGELQVKRDKLTREIEYVIGLLNSPGLDRQGVEVKKLEYGMEKLKERKLDIVKELYDLSVKISKLRRQDSNSGITDYFVRKASLNE